MSPNKHILSLTNGLDSHSLKEYLKGLSDINVSLWKGFNALHLSIFGGNLEIIKLILNLGANPNFKISSADIEVSDDDVEPDENITLSEPITEEFLDEINNLGNISAIHISVKNCSIEITELLLERNANPNIYDQGKCTPLHWSVSKNDQETVKLLLAHKANPNAQDIVGNTPLHDAVRRQKVDIINLLLDRDSDPNIKDIFGKSSLDLAKDNSVIFNLLLKKSNKLPDGLSFH